MKRIGYYLLLILLIATATGARASNKANSNSLTAGLSFFLNESDETFVLPSPDRICYQSWQESSREKFAFNKQVRKNNKGRFLLQNVNVGQYLKKGGSRLSILQYDPFFQKVTAVHAAEVWPIRPRYYTFLFRYNPF